MLQVNFYTKNQKNFYTKVRKVFINFANFYKETLDKIVNRPSNKFFHNFYCYSINTIIQFFKKFIPMEDRCLLDYCSIDEGSFFEYTQEQAQKVEARLIPLLQTKDSPYSRR